MRTINVTITDSNNDVAQENLDFTFNNIIELDTKIDTYILNEMQITRADVLLYDFNDCLTNNEYDYLTEKFYEFN